MYPVYEVAKPTEFYDIDRGIKTSLAKRVQESPIRYSILKSATQRFRETYLEAPQVDYDIDTAHKKDIKRAVDDSKVKLAAVFSSTDRFRRPLLTEGADIVYDTNTLRFNMMGKDVDESPIKYANIRSNAKRFGQKFKTDAPDIMYETDQGQVKTLGRSVKESAIKYAVMSSKAIRFKDPVLTTAPDIGPGTYDFPPVMELRRDQTERELSSFKSGSTRLNKKGDPTKNLGSTWNQDHDTKEWSIKSFKISNTKLSRPAYLPHVE